MFGCNPGFVPAGNMRAVCASDGRWSPDPAELKCRGKLYERLVSDMVSVWIIIVCGILITPLVSFGAPSFAIRVDVEPFNSTTVGSQIVYQCQSCRVSTRGKDDLSVWSR